MWKSTLDILFPRHCLYCQKLLPTSLPDTYLCEPCRELVPQNTVSRCAFCPRATTLWRTCPACAPDHALDRLLVATDYRDPVIERLVKALKYRLVQVVAHDIGRIMATYLEQRASLLEIPKNISISSIPLHPRRLRWRGFNQAELIANTIGTELSLPVQHDLLKRKVYKRPQAEIDDRADRIANAKGIFDLAVQPPSSTIILIDDVATTGATLDTAARLLKTAGAKKVIGFVFARG